MNILLLSILFNYVQMICLPKELVEFDYERDLTPNKDFSKLVVIRNEDELMLDFYVLLSNEN